MLATLVLLFNNKKSIKKKLEHLKKKSSFCCFYKKKLLHKSFIFSKKSQQKKFFLRNYHFWNFKMKKKTFSPNFWAWKHFFFIFFQRTKSIFPIYLNGLLRVILNNKFLWAFLHELTESSWKSLKFGNIVIYLKKSDFPADTFAKTDFSPKFPFWHSLWFVFDPTFPECISHVTYLSHSLSVSACIDRRFMKIVETWQFSLSFNIIRHVFFLFWPRIFFCRFYEFLKNFGLVQKKIVKSRNWL
jgi:hypothetical protein